MAITSPSFLLFITIVLLAFLLRASTRYRQFVLMVASTVFIVSQGSFVSQLVPLAAFVGAGYGLVWLSSRKAAAQIMAAAIGVYVFLFVYIKQYTVVAFLGSPLSEPYVTLGVSYILFRVLHLAIDTRASLFHGAAKPWNYFLYTCCAFTFVSGPIQRYEDFERQVSRLGVHTLSDDTVFKAFSRIANGMLIGVLVAEPLRRLHEEMVQSVGAVSGESVALPMFWASAIAYTLYMYSSFSSYMGIVIGLGWLFGFDLPENFDRPFESKNFLEFWSRWHMTLSRWFQSYVFNPVQLILVRRWSNPRLAPYLGVIAIFVAFLLMGVWHGSTVSFLIYGLMLGGGTSINRLYQVLMGRVIGKEKYGAMKRNNVYMLLCRGLTFSYFALALSCLWLDISGMAGLVSGHGAATWLLGWMVVSILSGTLISTVSYIEKRGSRANIRFESLRSRFLYRQAELTIKVAALIVLNVVGLDRSIEFVYQGF